MNITQAMIAAAPGALRVAPGNEYYVTEDLVYPFDFGNAIQNDVLGGIVRIFGQGHFLENLPGGGPFNGTTARGINIIGTTVELHDFKIRPKDGGLGKFAVGLGLPTYYTDGQPDYSRTPGRHKLLDCEVSGWMYGSEVMGDDVEYQNYKAINVGGGGAAALIPARPVGIRHFGRRVRGANMSVENMIKGAHDAELMHYHWADADDGVVSGIRGFNAVKHPGSFGIWWNTTSRMDLTDADLDGMEIVYAADLAAGTISGKMPTNFTTLSTLQAGPTLNLV